MKVSLSAALFVLLIAEAHAQNTQSTNGNCSPNISGDKNSVYCNAAPAKRVNPLLLMHDYFQKINRRYTTNLNCVNVQGTDTRVGWICNGLKIGRMETYDATKYHMAFKNAENASAQASTGPHDVLTTAYILKGYSAFLSQRFSGLTGESFRWASYFNKASPSRERAIEILFGSIVFSLVQKDCAMAEILFVQYRDLIKNVQDDDLVVKDVDTFVERCS